MPAFAGSLSGSLTSFMAIGFVTARGFAGGGLATVAVFLAAAVSI